MTIQAIIDILTEFSEKVRNCKAKTEAEYNKSLERYKSETKQRFMELRRQVPELVQINYDEEISDIEIKEIIESIRKNNSARKDIAPLVDGCNFYKDSIQNTLFYTPNLSYLSGISYVGSYWQMIIYSILAIAPISNIHFTFIDINMTGESTHLEINKKLYTNIFNQEQLQQKVKELRGRVEEFLQKDHVPSSFEFVFVLSGTHLMSYFSSLFSKGKDCRIFFLLANDSGDKWPNCSDISQYNKEASDNSALIHVTPIWSNPKLREALLQYANDETGIVQNKKEEDKASDYLTLCKQPYKETYSTLSVPIGVSEAGVHYFQLDTTSHVHSFIMGQSGSGKSVLLHNIILGAITTYAPDDLMLYLLDLKMGGVEFNRYQNVKHVRALLVDNSDLQITVEFLRDLYKLMDARGKQLRNAGVTGIEEYNKKFPKEKMPQVLFIADECHEMFNARGNKNSALFREMANIIEKIAREGRSQGVHLIMATQTLADAEISSEILNNITDQYLFKCSVGDSERLARDSSKTTGTLTTGHALYSGMNERVVLKSYFTSNEDSKVLMPKIVTKAKQHKDNRVCYFNGTQLFPFDLKEVKLIKKLQQEQPLVALGYNISLQHEAILFPLTRNDSENILIFGINDDQQVTRTTLNATVSLLMSLKALKKTAPIYLMDFLGLEEGIYNPLLQCLEADKQVTIVNKSQQAQILSQLSDNIIHAKEQEAVLVILGQERFSALKLDKDLELEMKVPEDTKNSLFGNISFNTSVQGGGKKGKNMKVPHTYREALELILMHGPVHGIHTIIQIDTPEKILFDDYISPRQIVSMFNHLVMLRSKNNIGPKLGLEDDIRLERLSSTSERLRAYYYHTKNNEYKLFTPYTKIENFNLNN